MPCGSRMLTPLLLQAAGSAVDSLPEVRQRAKFHKQLAAGEESGFDGVPLHPKSPLDVGLGREQMMRLIEVSMATFLLHVEARLFSYVGEVSRNCVTTACDAGKLALTSAMQGYYTIGPCGEEAMGALGLALRQTDPAALHYRHVTAQMARQAASGKDMDEILLDRARGCGCGQWGTARPPCTCGHLTLACLVWQLCGVCPGSCDGWCTLRHWWWPRRLCCHVDAVVPDSSGCGPGSGDAVGTHAEGRHAVPARRCERRIAG